jgi:hypothetical protein
MRSVRNSTVVLAMLLVTGGAALGDTPADPPAAPRPATGSAATSTSTQPSENAAAETRAARWLDFAESAARSIDRLQEPVDPTRPELGVRWRFAADDAHPYCRDDIYDGAAGIVLFELNLYKATNKQGYKDRCLAGARGLLARRRPAVARGFGTSFYGGTAGVGWALLQVNRALGDADCLSGARAAADAIIAGATLRDGRAVVGDGSVGLISGASGTLLFFTDLGKATGERRYLEFASALGDGVLAQERRRNLGGTWPADPGGNYGYLGASHGVAGVGHALAKLYEATGERRFLAGATDAAEFLLSRVQARDGGLAWPVYDVEPTRGWTPPEPLTGWCHGPAGTSRFFAKMSHVAPEADARERYARAALGGADFAAADLPRIATSERYWGLTYCCGIAGVGDLFLIPELRDAAGKNLGRARSVAESLAAAADRPSKDECRWTDSPSCAPSGDPCFAAGLQTGAAGYGTFFLHLYVAESGRDVKLVELPDHD